MLLSASYDGLDVNCQGQTNFNAKEHTFLFFVGDASTMPDFEIKDLEIDQACLWSAWICFLGDSEADLLWPLLHV